jgi:hypothetical protein
MKAAEEKLAASESAAGPSRSTTSRGAPPRYPEPGDEDLEMGGM